MAELLAPLAAADPDRAAIVDDDGRVRTRAELDTHVNRLVSGLRASGLDVGATVAIMAGNQIELFEVVLAASHAGWTVVPVNWHWVAEELAYVLADSGAAALIVDERWADVAADAMARAEAEDPGLADRLRVRVVVDRSATGAFPSGFASYTDLLATGSPGEPDDQRTGGPMFYTSGTTGFPKGVRTMLSANEGSPAVFGFIAGGFMDLLQMPREAVALLCGPAYHSAQFVFSVFPLVTGGTVVCQHRFDPVQFLDLIDEHQVTTMHLVPTQMVRLLKLDEETRAGFDGSSLERVYHGAAPCPPDVKRQMIEWWGPVIWEYYGGTEGGFLTLLSPEDWATHPGSVGTPTALVELTITDDDGRRLGPGEPGQIWFRSLLGTDFEYHNAPDKTASAHLEPGVGTLGDIGYVDDDGFLFMSDRKIDMIISGGVNIYPAEIEGVLVTHPSVADAAVFGIPDDEMGEQVKAAVELIEDTVASAGLIEDLAAHVRAHVAGYKVPRSFDVVDALPRNAAGKLQKRELRAPYWEGTGRSI